MVSQVLVRETDLAIVAEKDLTEPATHLVIQYRSQLENYLRQHPLFLTSLFPLPQDLTAPPVVREMLAAGQAAGVGPMAAVAGVIAEYVGRELLRTQGLTEIVVENGGDLYLKMTGDATIAIFAGESPLSNRVGLKIPHSFMPLGVCTSSATVGHSLSFGQADAVTVLAAATGLADAVATRICNEVKRESDVETALNLASQIPGILGVVIVMGENLGAWGAVELVELT